MKHREFVVALKFFKKALEQSRDFSFIHHYLGEAYFALSQFEEAEHAFLRAVALNPYFTPTLLFLGKLAEIKGDHSKKNEVYETALRVKGKPAKELKQLAQTLIKIGDAGHPAVFDLYVEAHRLNPQDFEIYLEIAEINPPDLTFYSKFGEYLAETGKTEQAIFFLYLAAHLEKEGRGNWVTLSEVLNKSGDSESAEICLQRAELVS